MDRRKVLLIVAALIAALGTLLVFLYVRGVDDRANQKYDAVQVLKAVDTIAAGESLESAQSAGKIQLGTVPRSDLLPGATTTTNGMDKSVALTTVYPGEQIISSKFGSAGDQDVLTIPKGKIAISVNLTDPARVAGFVNPGASVSIFMSGTGPESSGSKPFTRMLLTRVQVIGVGDTTVVPTTKTDQNGAKTTEQLPRTLLTLALDQSEAQKVLYGSANGELSVALLTDKSDVKPAQAVTDQNLFE
jgi:pilus assembly protein CpaB